MLLLTEGEKDPKPFVQGDFELPGYERKDVVVASKQYCAFLSTTEHRVGSREIQKKVFLMREIGGREVEVEAGIDAGRLWWTRKRLIKAKEGIDHRLLPRVRRGVERFEKWGFFDRWISNMQKEYESGQNFAGELIPAVLDRFSEYDLVINRFEEYKYVMFVRGGAQQRAVLWGIDSTEFSVSVGEIMAVLPGKEAYIRDFTVNGERYWAHDWRALWCPTKDRDTTYDIDDTDRRTKLLRQSFDTLEYFLEQY